MPYVLLFVAGLIVISSLVYGFAWFVGLPSWQIKNINITGFETIEQDELYASVEEALDGSFYYLIPKTQYLFLSTAGIADIIKEKFPKIRAAKVEKTFPDTLSVVIEERKIYAVYCYYARKKEASTTAETIAAVFFGPRKGEFSNCAYMDRDGVIMDSGAKIAGSLFPVIESDEKAIVGVGKEGIAKDVLDFFDKAGAFLKNKTGYELDSMAVSRDLPKDYLLNTKSGWYLIVSRDAQIEEWAAQLKIILESKIKERVKDLYYIDLRFGNKIFYKFKDGSGR